LLGPLAADSCSLTPLQVALLANSLIAEQKNFLLAAAESSSCIQKLVKSLQQSCRALSETGKAKVIALSCYPSSLRSPLQTATL